MSTPDKFNIVQFQAASGLPLTGDFISKTLGVEPDEVAKRAMFWNRDKYGMILGRLVNHINGQGAKNPCEFNGQRPKKGDGETPPTGSGDGFSFGGETANASAGNDSGDGFAFGGDEKKTEPESTFTF